MPHFFDFYFQSFSFHLLDICLTSEQWLENVSIRLKNIIFKYMEKNGSGTGTTHRLKKMLGNTGLNMFVFHVW